MEPVEGRLVRDLFVKAAVAIERAASKAVAADRREALGSGSASKRRRRFWPGCRRSTSSRSTSTPWKCTSGSCATRPVRCEPAVGGHVAITVVAADRPGLLVTLAGVLMVVGLDVLAASLFGTTDGIALDVFRAADPFGRIADDDGDASPRRSTRARGRVGSRGPGRRTAPR